MYTTLYTSTEHFDHEKMMQPLLNRNILCNVFPMQSVAQRRETGECFIETGAKVDIFDIAPDALIQLWTSMRDHLGIHCLYIECDGYSNCICNWAPYRQQCASNGMVPLECSEYD